MNADYILNWISQESHIRLNPKRPDLNGLNLKPEDLPLWPGQVWMSSSGSRTGGVTFYALSKSAFLTSAEAVNGHLNAKPNDVWINVLPHFHVGGLSIFARGFLSRSRVFDRSDEPWSAEGFLSWVIESGATLTSLVPTQLYDLVQSKQRAPSSLRAVVIGGAALDEELYFSARALGYNVLPSYGMTECCSQIATAELASLQQNEFPSLRLLPHVEAKLVEGRLAVRSKALFTGKVDVYRENGGLRTESLRRASDWYVTSDRALLQGHYLQPLGREDEQVKIAGELVSLRDLNFLFQKTSGNSRCLIMTQPEERRGAEIVLVMPNEFVHNEPLWTKQFNQQVLPLAKIRAVYFIEAIPTSEMGKPQVGKIRLQLGLNL